MGYAVFENKVYTYWIPRYSSDTTIILDDNLCGKSVLIDECTLFPHVCIRVKYRSEWYPFSKNHLNESGHLTLFGPYQKGFRYQYDAGGFPIYSKDVIFPDDISGTIIQITELKHSGEFVDSYYKFPIDKFDWTSNDLVIRILTEIYIDGQMEKVSVSQL